MGEQPVRSDEQYHADIRAVLSHFYQPGDSLTLVGRFEQRCKCQMCGDKVDIQKCFELQNDRTNERIVCGRRCIINYAEVLKQMDQQPVINFPAGLKPEADRINGQRPGTVTLLPADQFPYPDGGWGDWDMADGEGDEEYWGPDDDDEEADRELYMDLGLDPDDPNFSELAAEGLDGDLGDDDPEDDDEFDEDDDDEDLDDDLDDEFDDEMDDWDDDEDDDLDDDDFDDDEG